MSFRVKSFLAGAAVAVGVSLASFAAQAQNTIKVGILHSLSGTMAISETTLKDVMLMLIEEQNKKGGLLGKKLEAVVVDPASNWPLFAEKATRAAVQKDKVAAIFGCWTSVSPQVRSARVRGAEQRHPVLPCAVRRRRVLQEHLLHRRRPEPAGDPGRRLPDGEREGPALGARRHRLRLSAHDQQDPRGLPEVQGRQGRRHHDQLHAVRSFRLADDRRRHQEVRLGRQEDRRRVDHQRRRQRAVLQGARQPGREGDRHSGRRLLGGRGRTRRHRHQAAGRPSRRLELLPVRSTRPTTRPSSRSGRPTPRTRSA